MCSLDNKGLNLHENSNVLGKHNTSFVEDKIYNLVSWSLVFLKYVLTLWPSSEMNVTVT